MKLMDSFFSILNIDCFLERVKSPKMLRNFYRDTFLKMFNLSEMK